MSKETPWVKWAPADFLNGVTDLEPNEGWVYTIILNMIYDKQAGVPLDEARLSRRCRMRPATFRAALDSLLDMKKLTYRDGVLHNDRAKKVIAERAQKSAKSAESAKARWSADDEKGKGNKDGDDANAVRTQPGRIPIEKVEGREKKKKKAAPAKPPAGEDGLLALDGGAAKTPVEQAVDLYNQVAARVGGHRCKGMTEKRKAALAARMNGRGLVVWQEAMTMVEKSQFLCGEKPPKRGEEPFKLSIDMLLRPDNFQRLMEGIYGEDRDPSVDLGGEHPQDWTAERWARVMEIWRVSGAWPDDAGPKPGEPGCIAPSTGDGYDRQ